MRRPLVAVLHGAVASDAPPDERDTLRQAEEVAVALRRLGHAVTTRAVGLDLSRLRSLRALAPAAIFYLVEALEGEGRLQHLPAAVLDTLGLPYTGAPAEALHRTTDKPLAKTLMRAAGLPTPESFDPARHGDADDLFIVKAADEDASIGLDAHAVVPGRLVPFRLEAVRRRFGGAWFAERFVDGREFNLPLLEGADGPEALPLGEIEFAPGFPAGRPRIVDYAAKWDEAAVEYHTTPRRFVPRPGDGPLRARLHELALACWRAFGLRGYARVDFRVDGDGRPWILEVNANPCLSSDAGYVAAAAEAGLDQTELVRRILAAALRHAEAERQAPAARAAS